MDAGSKTLEHYLEQFSEYFEATTSGDEILKRLRVLAFDGQLRSCKFRSVCWRIFLRSLPNDVNKWTEVVEKSRQEYLEVKTKHIIIPSHKAKEEDLSVENPLSQNDQSEWMKYFKNDELRKTIERDVKRTFPEMEYFHNESVHELLVNILFCYAQEHSDLSYRQGMHELLAPLVFIIHCDLQAAAHAREIGKITDIINLILDEKYLEHDAYDMFCHLMESTNPWYNVTERGKREEANEDGVTENSKTVKTEVQSFPSRPFQPQEIANRGGPTLAITNKLNHIHNTLLVQHDLQLHTHLNRLEIIPQVFGLRWIRLLFGREFHLQDLLVLWDAIFADSSTLDLVDYLFVAMLIHIRKYLLNADYSTCMQILMKYPAVDDINDIVTAAKDIRKLKGRSFSDSLVETATKKKSPPQNNKILKNNNARQQTLQGSGLNKQNTLSKMFKDFTKKVIPDNKSVPQHSHLKDPTYAGFIRSPAQNKTGDMARWNRTIPGNHPSSRTHAAPRSEEMHRKSPAQLEEEVTFLQRELEKMKQMCLYCSDKIDSSVTVLQSSVSLSPFDDDAQSNHSLQNDVMAGDASTANEQEKFEKEQILVTVAGMKQIRDLLRGSLSFNPNLREYKLRNVGSVSNAETNNGTSKEPEKVTNGNQNHDTKVEDT